MTLSALHIASKFKLVPYAADIGVARAAQSTLDVYARPLSNLVVKVIARWPPKRGVVREEAIKGVSISASGPQVLKARTGADGSHRFDGIEGGSYSGAAVDFTRLEHLYTTPKPASVTLPAGETRELLLVSEVLAKLRFVVFDADSKPVSGVRWTVDSPVACSGTTGGNGLIEVPKVPLARRSGKLTLLMPTPPPRPPKKAGAGTPAAAPTPADPPPYPPDIKLADFTDVVPASQAVAGQIEWSLDIGLLDDYTDDRGVKVRLDNMGFNCANLADGPPLERVVKAYQRIHMRQPSGSGAFGDIKGHAIDLHDKP